LERPEEGPVTNEFTSLFPPDQKKKHRKKKKAEKCMLIFQSAIMFEFKERWEESLSAARLREFH